MSKRLLERLLGCSIQVVETARDVTCVLGNYRRIRDAITHAALDLPESPGPFDGWTKKQLLVLPVVNNLP